MSGWRVHLARAPATVGLLVLYLLVFLEQWVRGSASWLLEWLCMEADDVARGQLWRLLSYTVLHGNEVHILFNGWFMWSLGPSIERELGTGRFLLVYLVSSFTAGLAGCLWHGAGIQLVGGSGGLFGLVGALIAVHARAGQWVTEFLHWPAGRSLLNLLIGNVVLALVVPGISQAAHLGGLLGGFLLTFLALRPGAPDNRAARRALAAALLLLTAAVTAYCSGPFASGWYRARELIRDRRHPETTQAEAARLAGVPPHVVTVLRWLRARDEGRRAGPAPEAGPDADWRALGWHPADVRRLLGRGR